MGYNKSVSHKEIKDLIWDFFNYELDGKFDLDDQQTAYSLEDKLNDEETCILILYSYESIKIFKNGKDKEHDTEY